MEREAEIVTWLNGQDGLTIEDAVAQFVKRHKIDIAKEVAGE